MQVDESDEEKFRKRLLVADRPRVTRAEIDVSQQAPRDAEQAAPVVAHHGWLIFLVLSMGVQQGYPCSLRCTSLAHCMKRTCGARLCTETMPLGG